MASTLTRLRDRIGMAHTTRTRLRWSLATATLVLWVSMQVVLQVEGQPGFINIDCGANAPNYDTALNMTWSTDAGYTSAGVNAVDEGANTYIYNPVHALNTFRRFPGPRNKSCYSLPATVNSTYFIRASFLPQRPAPTFDLILEATTIKTVDTVLGEFVEMVLKATRADILVCLVRTAPSDDPYISALELRPLDAGMYALAEKGYYLAKLDRRNFGAQQLSLLRYPDDPFDRIWLGVKGDAVNTTHAISPGTATNKPPAAVMSTAMLVTMPQYLLWVIGVQYYVVLYFAEIDSNVNATSRAFDIALDCKPWIADFSILSAAAGCLYTTVQVERTYVPVSRFGNFTFTLSSGATAPPLLNAYEAYQVYDHVQPRTFLPDALVIEDLKRQLNLTDWSGDPCSPYPYDWIMCAPDPSGPRIAVLKLSNMNLSGPIPLSIGNLTAASSIWLDNNNFSGPIPDLSQLRSLSHLYLQHNSLTGVIPQWLVALPSLQELFLQDNNLGGSLPSMGNKPLIMNISGNAQLCKGLSACGVITNAPYVVNPRFHLLSIVAGGLGGLLLLVFAVYLLHCRLRRRCTSHGKPGKRVDKQHSFQNHTQNFTAREVRGASKNFSKKIGEGGFGPVYYGMLANGQEVAVKVSSGISKQGHVEFSNEVDLLSRIHHKNLVSLIGYCQNKDRQMLIYEYLPNGSVRDHLYGPLATTPLPWNTRLRIALDAAQGLEYLHMGCSPNIIHRDVKSSNILLTARMEAKVSDFGLSKLAVQEGVTHISTLVKGTAGYLDPEYYISQKLTVKSDVYSFGVVLLELICGRPPINVSLTNPSQKLSLTELVRPHLQAGDLHEIVDPGLQADYSMEGMWKVIEVAMTSVEPKDSHRPNMQEVVQELREAVAMEEQRCAKLEARQAAKEGRSSSSSETKVDFFTDTSQESVGSRYSLASPR